MTTLKGLQSRLSMYGDFNMKEVVFIWPVDHWHVLPLVIPFSKWAYMSDRVKKEKLNRFLRYAKRQGRVILSRKEARG